MSAEFLSSGLQRPFTYTYTGPRHVDFDTFRLFLNVVFQCNSLQSLCRWSCGTAKVYNAITTILAEEDWVEELMYLL